MPTYECGGDAADGVTEGADDLQRLVFGELQQQQIAPSSADPKCHGALHQQGLHTCPGGAHLHGRCRLAALPASATRVVSAGRAADDTRNVQDVRLSRAARADRGVQDGKPCVRAWEFVPYDLSAVDAVHQPLAPLIPDLHSRRSGFAQVDVFIYQHPRHKGFNARRPLLPERHTTHNHE